MKIAGKNPGIEFWQSMAKKESLVKGKRGERLGLVQPDGFDEIVEGISTSGSEDLDDDDRDLSSEGDEQPAQAEHRGEPPRKVHAFTSSFVASRTMADSSDHRPRSLTSPGEDAPFLILQVRKPVVAGGSGIGQDASTLAEPGSQVSGQNVPRKREEEPTEGVYHAQVDRQIELFDRTCTLAGMIEHILLEKKSSKELLAIFRDISAVQEPKLGKLISPLKTHEFTPQLLKVSYSHKDDSTEVEEFEIGDCLGIHREFQVHSVRNSADLHEEIVRFGRLYSYTRHLNMVTR